MDRERASGKELAQKIHAALKQASRSEVRSMGAAFQKAVKDFQSVQEIIDEKEKILVKKVEASMSAKQSMCVCGRFAVVLLTQNHTS